MIELIDAQKPWEAVLAYHTCMQKMISAWTSFFKGEFHSDFFQLEEIESWLTRLVTTMDLIRDDYMYDTLRRVQVYPVASGFPDRLHLQLLGTKKSRLSEERGSDLEVAKRTFLDHLFTHKRPNNWMLEQLSKAHARELLLKAQQHTLFTIRKLQEVTGESHRPAYVCCFERYCYRHIPTLYLVMFEYSGENLDDELAYLRTVMEEDTSSLPMLEHFARRIDQAIAPIHPKWIGRISLGPVFIGQLTQDEHLLQEKLNELGSAHEYHAASRVIHEHILSAGETPVERLYDAQGRAHASLQTFVVRELNEECVNRRVSGVEKYLFAPHRIIQVLDQDFRNEIGHNLLPLEVYA